MSTDRTRNGADAAASGEMSQTEVFDVLRNQRRRSVVEYLEENEGPVELGELATVIAAWEYDTTPDEVTSKQRKRVYTTLQQTHLPRLDDEGIVEFDSERGTIERDEAVDKVAAYLHIVPGDELPWREYYLSVGAIGCALTAALALVESPLMLLSPLAWLGVFAAVITVSAGIQVYYEEYRKE
ncbi:hypothetical protein BRD17_06615 [Halobacteriales archaeon SW_7_68_16]|nr:MAG: hypothetical protein BRD17_06615 [Halobacteriales archaeon SW_7_68_16]